MEFVKDGLKVAASMIIVLAAALGYTYLFYQEGYEQGKKEIQPVIIYTVDNAGGVITDVKIGEQVREESDWGETTSKNTVTIYHNQNPIALAECEANDGNGGYYYSVASLVIGEIHFPVAEA